MRVWTDFFSVLGPKNTVEIGVLSNLILLSEACSCIYFLAKASKNWPRVLCAYSLNTREMEAFRMWDLQANIINCYSLHKQIIRRNQRPILIANKKRRQKLIYEVIMTLLVTLSCVLDLRKKESYEQPENRITEVCRGTLLSLNQQCTRPWISQGASPCAKQGFRWKWPPESTMLLAVEFHHSHHHCKALTKAVNESTSLFSEGYLIGLGECLGKNSIVGKLPSCSSCCANFFCSPSALNFPTFIPLPASFSANSSYDPSMAYIQFTKRKRECFTG